MTFQRTASRSLCALLPLAGALSCTTNANPALLITAAHATDPESHLCVAPTPDSTDYLPRGVLDVDLDKPYPYTMYPVGENNLLPGSSMQIEFNNIRLTAVQVKINPPAGMAVTWKAGCGSEFDFPVSVLAEPGAKVQLMVDVIRACNTEAFNVALNAYPALSKQPVEVVIRLKGEHGGSSTILSDEFSFTVDVCKGCLQTGFSGVGFEDLDYPTTTTCDSLFSNPFPGNPCGPAQDFGPVLCCANSAGTIECPGRPRGAPGMP